jgi:hypothetical protein
MKDAPTVTEIFRDHAQIENTSASKDHIRIAAIGESSAIDKEVERLHNTDRWAGTSNATDLEDIARRFIALEIVDKPRWVGSPVSIVVVDADGIHWVERGAWQPNPLGVIGGTGIRVGIR